MSPQRMNYLIDRFLTDSCTEEEKEELALWADRSANDDELKEMLEQAWLRHEATVSMPGQVSERIQASFFRQQSAGGPAEKESAAASIDIVERPPSLSWLAGNRRWWAAAAIFLLAAAGLYLLSGSFSGNKTVRALPGTSRQDIAPGGNKAILTLGRGEKILLDSAANGMLAQQGNATVSKTSNGQLVYDLSKNNSGRQGREGGTLYNTISTPRGGQYHITLSDGTGVWLNSASSITYPAAFNGNERAVQITGEAYFEVAQNKQKPFHVQAGTLFVQVLGTHFNINAYEDEGSSKTSLLEGAVKIGNGKQVRVLSPGEQGQADPGGEITLLRHANVEQAVAWKDGIFSFRDADIRTVMRQLARWYNIEVVYRDGLPNAEFSGEIGRNLSLAQVLKGLAQEKVHYLIEDGNKIVILP